MAVLAQKFTIENDAIAGYLAYPKRAKRGPAILIIHHNHGLTEELRLEAFDYAELGYTVFIPNMYQLIGIFGPILPGQGQDIQKVKSDTEFLRRNPQGLGLPARPARRRSEARWRTVLLHGCAAWDALCSRQSECARLRGLLSID